MTISLHKWHIKWSVHKTSITIVLLYKGPENSNPDQAKVTSVNRTTCYVSTTRANFLFFQAFEIAQMRKGCSSKLIIENNAIKIINVHSKDKYY